MSPDQTPGALPEEFAELATLAQTSDAEDDLLDGEPITPENIMKKLESGDLDLPPEMKQCLDELKAAQQASANPSQYIPGSPDYNPYAGKSIGFVIREFLAYTPNIGVRRFAESTKVMRQVESPDGNLIGEAEILMDRKRLQDIIDEKAEPDREEYEALAIALQGFVVRDAAARERKKAGVSESVRHKELIARATRRKTGMNRAEFRRMRASNKTKK